MVSITNPSSNALKWPGTNWWCKRNAAKTENQGGRRDQDRKWKSARRRLMDVSMKVGGGGPTRLWTDGKPMMEEREKCNLEECVASRLDPTELKVTVEVGECAGWIELGCDAMRCDAPVVGCSGGRTGFLVQSRQ